MAGIRQGARLGRRTDRPRAVSTEAFPSLTRAGTFNLSPMVRASTLYLGDLLGFSAWKGTSQHFHYFVDCLDVALKALAVIASAKKSTTFLPCGSFGTFRSKHLISASVIRRGFGKPLSLGISVLLALAFVIQGISWIWVRCANL